MSKKNRNALSEKHMKKSLAEAKKQCDREWHMQKHPDEYPTAHEQLNKFVEELK